MTKFLLNAFVAAALIAAVVALVAMTRHAHGADYRATLPPARYDHAYKGKIVVHRLSTEEAILACLKFGYQADGCAFIRNGKECHIVISKAHPPEVVTTIFRHERGHCNGWPADHPGAR